MFTIVLRNMSSDYALHFDPNSLGMALMAWRIVDGRARAGVVHKRAGRCTSVPRGDERASTSSVTVSG